jgi:hypothetical protein
MTRLFCSSLALTGIAMALLGCVTDQLGPVASQPTPVASQPAPTKEPVFSKPGATNEEFQRARAACLMQMEEAAPTPSDVYSPQAQEAFGRRMSIFGLCMRANGWALVWQ